MRKMIMCSLAVGALLVVGGRAQAQDNSVGAIADNIKKGCSKELSTFCKGVVPGEGRVLACLYAFESKVSDKCVYAVYDAVADLEQAVVALKFAASQCHDDLTKFCASVKLGEGRGLACLSKHQKDVSQQCTDALKQTGLRK
jgi:hypothetical protein